MLYTWITLPYNWIIWRGFIRQHYLGKYIKLKECLCLLYNVEETVLKSVSNLHEFSNEILTVLSTFK